jgi:hypothetical protein
MLNERAFVNFPHGIIENGTMYAPKKEITLHNFKKAFKSANVHECATLPFI